MAQKRKPLAEVETIGLGAYYLWDCVSGAREFVADSSVDLVITDPPYGIDGSRLHRHYNRDERFVVGDYFEIPKDEYGRFSLDWVKELERVLKPGGQAYIISGYTNLYHILHALRQTSLVEINHIIWKYNFGVFTRSKFVSSHYHILYYVKPGGSRKFNLESRYGLQEKNRRGELANYRDREDVWPINREYRPQQSKNKNSLPTELIIKILQYSSSEGDLVCDFFMGGFSTARAAIGLNRRFIGFEKSKRAFRHHVEEMRRYVAGSLIGRQKLPQITERPENEWKPWRPKDLERLEHRFESLKSEGHKKQRIVEELMRQFGRGRWAIEHALKRLDLRYSD